MLSDTEIRAIAAEVVSQLKPLLGIQSQELTDVQVAELLNVSRMTIARWTASGIIPSYKVGRCRRYNRSAVLEAARDQQAEADCIDGAITK